MRKVLALAQKSFQENIRNKIFVVFLLFAAASVLSSILFELLTFTAKLKIIKDVGFAGISVFSCLIAIFLSGEAIVGEVERKNIYILLSKPVDRKDFIIGSFLGVIWTTGVAILISGGVLLFLIYLKQGFIEPYLLTPLLFVALEVVVIASIGIVFSSFCSSALTSSLLCFLIYILGHLSPHLNLVAKTVNNKIVKGIIRLAMWVLPNLEYFNVRDEVVKGNPPQLVYVGEIALYTAVYSTICLIIAHLLFQRRQL